MSRAKDFRNFNFHTWSVDRDHEDDIGQDIEWDKHCKAMRAEWLESPSLSDILPPWNTTQAMELAISLDEQGKHADAVIQHTCAAIFWREAAIEQYIRDQWSSEE